MNISKEDLWGTYYPVFIEETEDGAYQIAVPEAATEVDGLYFEEIAVDTGVYSYGLVFEDDTEQKVISEDETLIKIGDGDGGDSFGIVFDSYQEFLEAENKYGKFLCFEYGEPWEEKNRVAFLGGKKHRL